VSRLGIGLAALVLIVAACGSSETGTPPPSLANVGDASPTVPGASAIATPSASAGQPVLPGMEPVVTHGTITGRSVKVASNDGYTYTLDVTIAADLRWNSGLAYTASDAIQLTGGTYSVAGTATGYCSTSQTPTATHWPMAGTLTQTGDLAHKVPEEDLTAESHILRVGIAMDHQFTDGLARMSPVGSLWVPLQCDRVYTDRMYEDACDLELSITAPGVVDGSCKRESSDEFGPIHIEWTAHFAP